MREVLSSFVMGRCLRSRRDGATEQEKERETKRIALESRGHIRVYSGE